MASEPFDRYDKSKYLLWHNSVVEKGVDSIRGYIPRRLRRDSIGV